MPSPLIDFTQDPELGSIRLIACDMDCTLLADDKTQPENLEFLRRLRAVMNEFPNITSVGEVGESQRGIQVQADYTAGDDLLHMCYGFDFLAPARPTGTISPWISASWPRPASPISSRLPRTRDCA